MKIFSWFRSLSTQLIDMQSRIHKIQEAIGRIEGRQVGSCSGGNVFSKQYRVFSQWGEDGIIQGLISAIDIPRKVFIEFGVQNYTESNTRFLLINNNWAGLLIDGGADHVAYIKNDPVYWQHNLKVENCFINCKNINEIFMRNGVSGEIGLLSVDIDGNDFWVWRSITVVNPAIVIVEYNARFGKDRAVTVPYDPEFTRSSAHYSNIYYGASLKALYLLAKEKGYGFVGTNSAGSNAFFVRRDLLNEQVPEISLEEGFMENKFRESRGQDGALAFLDSDQERKLLETLPLVDVTISGDLSHAIYE
jgi:hypothetical protein